MDLVESPFHTHTNGGVMKKTVSLLATSSTIILLSTQVYAGGDVIASASMVSSPYLKLSIEGWYARTNDFRSIMEVDDTIEGKLKAQSKLGWAVDLGYVFTNKSDLTFSFRHIKKENTKTHAHDAVQGLRAHTNMSANVSYTATGTTNFIGNNGTTNSGADSFAWKVGTLYHVETGELTYQQANIDWGHTFLTSRGFSFRPYVGAAWRHIGYNDTMRFYTKNNAGSALTTNDYVTSGNAAAGVLKADSGDDVYDITTGTTLTRGSAAATMSTTASGVTSFHLSHTINETNPAHVAYLGNYLPSYDSSFTGVGPHFGVTGKFVFNDNIALVSGIGFSAPYGTLKTKAELYHFRTSSYTGSLKSGGKDHPTTVQDASIHIHSNPDGSNAVNYVSSEHKVIPEMSLNLGIRFASDLPQEGGLTVYAEAGYRIIHDWNAIKNIDFAATTAIAADDTRGAAFQYADESDFGPYLKFGMTFGT